MLTIIKGIASTELEIRKAIHAKIVSGNNTSRRTDIEALSPDKGTAFELRVMQIAAISSATITAAFGAFCHILKEIDPSLSWTACLIACTILGYFIGMLSAALGLRCCRPQEA